MIRENVMIRRYFFNIIAIGAMLLPAFSAMSEGRVVVGGGETDEEGNAIAGYEGEEYSFDGNGISGSTFAGNGGAVFVNANGTIVLIQNATFSGNQVTEGSGDYAGQSIGGVIDNQSTITKVLNAIFEDNKASGNMAFGGAINNGGSIGTLGATFSRNKALADGEVAMGGAVSNSGEISYLRANFSENEAKSEEGKAYGGGLYNDGFIAAISGQEEKNVTPAVFSENTALVGEENDGDGAGGGIYNEGGISQIYVKFEKNVAQRGGGVFNVFKEREDCQEGEDCSEEEGENQVNNENEVDERNGYIETLSGSFEGNTAKNKGGGLYNGGRIVTLSADFQGNMAAGDRDEDGMIKNGVMPKGGAVYNDGGIEDISSEFVGNSAMNGGAIYNTVKDEEDKRSIPFKKEEPKEGEEAKVDKNNGYIGKISGLFQGNVAGGRGDGVIGGGAIYNDQGALIEEINATFENNEIDPFLDGDGGAILNRGRIKAIGGSFTGNSTLGSGGGIYNISSSGDFTVGLIDSIEADFTNNTGSAIFNNGGSILKLSGTFTGNGNSAINNQGGAIGDLTGTFKENSGDRGGAILNMGTLGLAYDEQGKDVDGNVGGTFSQNLAGSGGGLYNNGSILGDEVTLNFNNNEAWTGGGGLYNSKVIPRFEGSFSENVVRNATKEKVTPGSGIVAGGGMFNGRDIISKSRWVNVELRPIDLERLDEIVRAQKFVNEMKATFNDNAVKVITSLYQKKELGGEASGDDEIRFVGYGGGLFVDQYYGHWVDEKGERINDENYSLLSIDKINSSFQGNKVVVLADDGVGGGGAVYNAGWINALGADYLDNKVFVNYDSEGIWDAEIKETYLGDVSCVNGKGYGGALYNSVDGTIGTVAAAKQENQGSEQEEEDKATSFEGSLVSVAGAGGEAYGGAIYNAGEIDKMVADFSDNTAEAINGGAKAWGGAIANVYEKNLYKSTANTVLKDVDATFTNNIARVSAGNGAEILGGAVYNSGEIVNMNATFSGNTADSLYDPEAEKKTGSSGSTAGVVKEGKGVNYAYGGALYNEGEHGKIQNLQADFSQNSVIGDLVGAGGAIYNKDGMINNISGVEEGKRAQFIDNVATVGALTKGATPGVRSVQGGAIYNGGVVNTVNAEFSGNMAQGKADTNVEGGAVYNSGVMAFENSDFNDNKAETGAGKGRAFGGAVYNSGTITFVNSNFSGNSVSSLGSSGQGGAIYNASGEVNIIAQGKNSTFRDNTANDMKNAIYMQDGILNLTAKEEGNVIFHDNISGYGYDDGKENYVRNYVLNINGDGSGLTYDEETSKWVSKSNKGEIYFNNISVDNIKTLNLNEKSVLHLGKTTNVSTYDFNGNGGLLKIDMAVNRGSVQSGIINVLNDVTGDTDVVINSLNDSYYSGANSVFLRAPKDDLSTDSSFNIAAVYGSPYMWIAKLNYGGETVGSTWYMVIDKEAENPNNPVNPDNPGGNDGDDDPDNPGGNDGDDDDDPNNPGGNGGNSGKSCEEDPTQTRCEGYCEDHPENPKCGNGSGNGDGNGGYTPTPEECDINPNQPGCGSYCERHPEDMACRGMPTDDECDVNPNQPGCGSYCERHPEASDCQGGYNPKPEDCDVNSNQPGCGSYCERHPEDSSCQTPTPGDCDLHPNQSGCGSYCERHPEDLDCQGGDNIPNPGDCDMNPNQAGCGSYCERHPEDLSCRTPTLGECDMNPNQPGCGSYCERHPEDSKCQGGPSSEECDINPNQSGCGSYCERHPEDSRCQGDPTPEECDINPNQPGCGSFCERHPENTGCKIPYCRTHPNAPVCKENYCETHPHIAACKDLSYCERHPTDYVCKDDSYCDTHPNALVCRDRTYCKTHPKEPACEDIAYCVTHPREYVCLDESAEGDGGNYKVYYQPEVPAYVAI